VVVASETLSDVKRRLLQQRIRGNQTQHDRIARRPDGVSVPLSPEQRRIWLHAYQQPDAPFYNEPFTIHRDGPLDVNILKSALQVILDRHEAWRTSFSAEGKQIVHENVTLDLRFFDLSKFSIDEREAEAQRIANVEAQRPFSLTEVPLFRAHVVRLEPEKHRLDLTFHHIIFDGISIARIFLPELAATYLALSEGRTADLISEPSLQYADYAIWREEHAKSAEVRQRLSYWLEHLAGELPVLRLPEDRPRPAMPSHRGSIECFHIQQSLLSRLKDLSSERGVTPYILFVAAFNVLLFRYSGQSDLILGSVTDGRRRPELVHMLGNFLDTFAIRTRPNAELPFTEFLAQTREAVLGGLAASDVPFDDVVRELNPPRSGGRHPVFQAFLSIRPPLEEPISGWRLTHSDVTVEATKFDLYLELSEQPDGMECRLVYSSEIWASATIVAMMAHWLVLLESICLNPTTRLGDLAILVPDEVQGHFGVRGWNDTALEIPDATLDVLIARQAELRPNHVAVECGGSQWTYNELCLRAGLLASRLRSIGIGPRSTVAVALNRSPDLVASLIAIHRLGAAYVPLDLRAPRERILLCLADAKPDVLMTERALVHKISNGQCVEVVVDEIEPEDGDVASISAAMPSSGQMDFNAYTIYTSGTTGEPKGVDISQRSLVNLLVAMQIAPGFEANDVFLAITPISFDIAALELFLPLISGGKVVIASTEESLDPHLLADTIVNSSCTVMQATPSTWRMLLNSGWKLENSGRGRRSQLRKILCGGESMSGELAERLVDTGLDVWNMYGPTETTIWSMIHRVSEASTKNVGSIPVGLPIANTTAYVLDANLKLVPANVPGELFLGGIGLAKGYRGKPEKTADRFLSVECVPNEMLYRTGDIAVRREDGTVQVVGRTDNQVKVRGHRIELEAVEAAVLRHPAIVAAAARVWPEETGGSRLCAYVVPADSTVLTSASLRTFLEGIVPDSMIPSELVLVDAIPITKHGKIDRAKLPAPNQKERLIANTSENTQIEAEVASIWESLLGVSDVGPDDNFFNLGGHSVLVASLQQRIAAGLDKRVSMIELFQYPTVRQQAELLLENSTNKSIRERGMLALQPQGHRTSVFWIHDLNGNLSRAIGIDNPFYSVEFTLDDMRAEGTAPSLQAIAACHVRKILETHKEGPYVIGGLCVWGILAYEVARQLLASGHTVQLLVLLDAPNPEFQRSFESLGHRITFFHYLLGRALRLGPRISFSRISDRLRRWTTLQSAATPVISDMRAARETIESAAKLYQPEAYDGEVLLILASDHPPHLNFLPGWQKSVPGRLHTRFIEGHHRDLMHSQNVDKVAQAILAQLDASPKSGTHESPTRSDPHQLSDDKNPPIVASRATSLHQV
jgi:amino acid adenylation domain-containing protein